MRSGFSFGMMVCCGVLLRLLMIAPIAFAAKSDTDKISRGKVTVQVDRRAYPVGTPIKVQVLNRSSDRIALPGCASYSIQRFEGDDFTPLPPRRCE